MTGKKKIEELGRVSTLNNGTVLPIAYYNSGTDRFVTRGISFLDFITNLPTPSGGDVLYGNVYFVDAIHGDDGTGAIGNLNKPYTSITTAISAAVTAGFNSSNRAIIWIRSGVYSSIIGLADGIDMYWDTNTLYYGELRDNGATVNVNVYGNCIFKGSRALFTTGNSTISLQFDYGDVSDAFVIASPPTESFLNIEANYIRATGVATGYGNSFRGKSNVTMKLRDYGTSFYTFFDIRSSYSGKFRAYIPETRLENGGANVADFKNCVYIRSCSNADIEINTNWVNYIPSYPSMYGVCVIGSAVGSKITLNGNINALDSIAVFFAAGDANTTLIFEGDISTTYKVFDITNIGKIKIRNSNILQTTNTAQHVFAMTAASSVSLQCQNVTIVSESSTNNIFNCSDDSAELYAINTYAYKTVGTGSFTNGNTSWDVVLVNCICNVDMVDATSTNLITAAGMGFEFDTQFKLIN